MDTYEQITACRYIFRGRVQGVGFRKTTCEIVNQYDHLSGWVRNELDGSVSMHIQGPEEKINTCLHQIVKLSRLARLIESVSKTTVVPEHIRGFEIRP